MATIELTGYQAETMASALLESAAANMSNGLAYIAKDEVETVELLLPAIWRDKHAQAYRETTAKLRDLIDDRIEKDVAGIRLYKLEGLLDILRM